MENFHMTLVHCATHQFFSVHAAWGYLTVYKGIVLAVVYVGGCTHHILLCVGWNVIGNLHLKMSMSAK